MNPVYQPCDNQEVWFSLHVDAPTSIIYKIWHWNTSKFDAHRTVTPRYCFLLITCSSQVHCKMRDLRNRIELQKRTWHMHVMAIWWAWVLGGITILLEIFWFKAACHVDVLGTQFSSHHGSILDCKLHCHSLIHWIITESAFCLTIISLSFSPWIGSFSSPSSYHLISVTIHWRWLEECMSFFFFF